MVDFAKMLDPEWQAQRRLEREKEEVLREAHDKKLRAAVELCLIVCEGLPANERSLVRNCRMRLNTYVTVSAAQEKWLLDIAARVLAEAAGMYAAGDAEGEHPTYPRASWPHAKEFDGASCAYWAWVLHQEDVARHYG